MSCNTTIKLVKNNDSIVIYRTDNSQQLTIDRKTGAITNGTVGTIPSNATTYEGLVGALPLISGLYLIVIKSCSKLGELFQEHYVHQVGQFEVIRVAQEESFNKLTSIQQSDEAEYINLLESEVLNKDPASFYFSPTYDLSCSVQEHFKRKTSSKNEKDANIKDDKDLWSKVDDQFVWNQYLSSPFRAANQANWVTPIIRGFVALNRLTIKGETFDFHVVSRLSWKRVGTRYNIRGIDKNGNAANFVETEQIIKYKNDLKSFLQVRGSIPLLWSQKPNLKYKPKTILKDNSQAAFQSHFAQILPRYEKLILINLIDLKGSEKLLADEYERQTKILNNSNIRYVSFDFHKETKGMKYENISRLVSQVEKDIQDFGYFWIDLATEQVKRKQIGTLRVNCIDCLDRTNVIESTFGRIFMLRKLQEIKLLNSNEKLETYAELERLFKEIWANNGDLLSKLYSGTGALKADFTRTGKRTLMGVWNDGVNSATRYYLNNFKDGRRQDAMNLMLGKYVVDPKGESPFKQQSTTQFIYSMLKVGFLAGLVMIAANVLKLPLVPSWLKWPFNKTPSEQQQK